MVAKDNFQSVLHTLSTLMLIDRLFSIILTQWNANQCYSLQTLYLHVSLRPFKFFPNSFIDFYSCKVVLSSDMKKNGAKRFTCLLSIMGIARKLWIYFVQVVGKWFHLNFFVMSYIKQNRKISTNSREYAVQTANQHVQFLHSFKS